MQGLGVACSALGPHAGDCRTVPEPGAPNAGALFVGATVVGFIRRGFCDDLCSPVMFN